LKTTYLKPLRDAKTELIARKNSRLSQILYAHPVFKKKDDHELVKILADANDDIRKYFNCFYDEKSAVGRRYRRQDEAGTPFCITVDGQTKEDQTVTVRERDSMKQERINVAHVKQYLRDKLDL